MGFNTVLMINNDCLHEIEKNDDFGREVSEAVSLLHGQSIVRISGGYVLATFHNSTVCVALVGGNCGSVLGWGTGTDGNHLSDEDRKKIVKQLVRDQKMMAFDRDYNREVLKLAKAAVKMECHPDCTPRRKCARCQANQILLREGYQVNSVGSWVPVKGKK